MRVLVTGGAGFVGGHIVKALVQGRADVICFDASPPSETLLDYLGSQSDRVKFVQGKVDSKRDVLALDGADITSVVHAAAFSGILREVEMTRSRSIVETNVMGLTNTLEFARRRAVRRFVYVSSESVYGTDPRKPNSITEAATPRPRTLYAVTKLTGEHLTRRYGDLFGLSTVSVRLGPVFGALERVTPHRANQSLVKEWTDDILAGRVVTARRRSIRRSLMYAEDAARGISAVLTAPTLPHDLYNLGSEERVSLQQITRLFTELLPDARFEFDASHAPPRGGNTLSTRRIREDLAFTCKFNFDSSMRDYIRWRLGDHR